MDLINLLCLYFDNVLVSTSTTMSSIEQYSNMSSPFSTHFRTKWCWTSTCFVWTCWVGLFVNDIAPWLSHRNDANKWTCEHECKPMSMSLWVGTNIFGIFWWWGQNILKISLCHVRMTWQIFLGKSMLHWTIYSSSKSISRVQIQWFFWKTFKWCWNSHFFSFPSSYHHDLNLFLKPLKIWALKKSI
jgi:hypothetical protein